MNIKFSTIIGFGIFIAVGVALWQYPSTFRQTIRPTESILHVGTSADYQPFSYIENGKIVGFDIEIIKTIGKRLNKKVIITDMPFDMLIAQLQTGSIDVIAAGITATPERAKVAFFTDPHYFGPPLLMVTLNGKPSINHSDELANKRVIVNQGFTADEWISGIPGPIVHRLPTVADAFVALENDKGDVFITAEACIKPYLKMFGADKFNIVQIDDTVENVGLAVSKQKPELFAEIRTALGTMIKDGTLGKITKKWSP